MSGEADAALARWAEAAENLVWDRRWSDLFEPGRGAGRWFAGGALNAAVNCVDRHLAERGDRPAFHWEGEPGDRRTVTYAELHAEVQCFAAALRRLGIGAVGRDALYMGWIPEAIVAVLGCARIGAVSSLVPVSLPAEALADRLSAFRPRVLVTQDGAWRHGLEVPLKERADEALATLTEPGSVDATVVVRRTGSPVEWFEGDQWYGELVAAAATAAGSDGSPSAVAADSPLLVQYLGGHRHQPLGVVLPTAGLLVCAAELHRRVFSEIDGDVLWAAMELSFINGIAQGVLGPLCAGRPAVMYEGTLDTPTWNRAWGIIERYGVSTLFTTPSTVRQLRLAGERPAPHDLGSLRLVVTGGERSDEADSAWLARLGPSGGPLVANAWGQTETGGAVWFSPLPQGPGSLPDPGVAIVDGSGQPVADGSVGELVLRHPWPGLFLDVEGHGDVDGRYWRYGPSSAWTYATGDLARRDADSEVEIIRRLDSAVKVSGQLVSLADIAEVLAEHPLVEEAIAVQTLDAEGGRSMLGCVVLTDETGPTQLVADDLCRHVHECLGGLARPANIAFLDSHPVEVPPTVLHRALALVGAGRAKSEGFVVTAAQLHEAIAATLPV
jgi:acetyl-CoA synthetase